MYDAETVLERVPGATHFFEEPGALDKVARLAGGWFGQWLGAGVVFSANGAK